MSDEKQHGDLAGGNATEPTEEQTFVARMLQGLGATEMDRQALLETLLALRLLIAFRGAGAGLIEDVEAVMAGKPVVRTDAIGADWTVAPFGFADTRNGQRYDFRVQLIVTAHPITEAEAAAARAQGKPDGAA